MWRTKVPEIMGFSGMLLMFIAVTYCKGYRNFFASESQDQKFEHLSESMINNEQRRDLTVKEQICRNYSLLLYAGAVLFFSYIGHKLLGKYKERGEKMKAIRKMKKE